jgi:transcriptional regulator with XRE-family HTH domain
MPPPSPVVARREFSRRIRRRRRELGIAAEEVSQHLGFSRVYYSKVENHHTVLADAKIGPLVDLLRLEPRDAAELSDLLRISRTVGWWAQYSSLVGEEFVEFLGVEHGAERVRIYEGRVITGILQTEAYATAAIAAAPEVSMTDVADNVEVRLRRQARLDPPDPLGVEVVLSEAALMQQFGGPEVLRDQLVQLVARAEDESSMVDLRVQPFNITPLGLTSASTVMLFDFATPHLSTVAWREAGGRLGIIDDPGVVARLMLNYQQVLASSLDRPASLDLVRKHIEELGTGR